MTRKIEINEKTRQNPENKQTFDFFEVWFLKQEIPLLQIDPEACGQLPREVDNFAQLCPMEPPPPSPMHKSQTFGYVTSVYKATNTKNGQFVALRRIHGFRLVNTKCMVRKIPNLVFLA